MSQRVFNPCGVVEIASKSRASRTGRLTGLRLAVLDNTKWNGAKLLDAVVARLETEIEFGAINRYKKKTFTKPAAPELLREIAASNDLAVIAIAD
ncbi:MAG: hypothetical protein PVSMB1_07910 [Gemmatimonadaceae bacterium]